MTVEDVLTLPFTDDIVLKTINNTIKKYRYTSKNLMYGRTPVELLDNIFMGDIAKNCIYSYLKSNCSNADTIIDYDEIRTDNFEKPDPGWDFIVGTKKTKIEIKSSIPPNGESHENIIALRDIKITKSHDRGRSAIAPQNLEADIHIQVYFYAKAYKNGYDNFDKLYNDISTNLNKVKEIINLAKYSKPLFFGWSTKNEIIEFKNRLSPNTWTFPKTDRIYWRCPISEAHNMPELIDYIENN